MQFDVLNMSIDESEWFLGWLDNKRFTADDLRRVRLLLVSCTTWTSEEIGKLTLRELIESIKTIGATEQSADPLVTTDNSSSSGPMELGELSPAG